MSAANRPPSPARRAHVVELDLLKGVAILWVICIHAKFLEETFFHEAVINRAVPIFMVAFGITSELWWRGAREEPLSQRLRSWYAGRARRILGPFWAMATLWWLAAMGSGVAARDHATLAQVLSTYLGFSPWIGPSWFVTLLLQFILLFPLLRACRQKLGTRLTLVASALATAWSLWNTLSLIVWGQRLFGNGVNILTCVVMFAPLWVWHVMAGVVVADRWNARPPRLGIAVSLLFFAAGAAAQAALPRLFAVEFAVRLGRLVLAALADVPLAIALLGALHWVSRLPRATRVLAWLGVSSWGIYLGHVLVHELVHMLGFHPETGSFASRLCYAILLLATGAGLAALGSALRERTLLLLTARRAYS